MDKILPNPCNIPVKRGDSFIAGKKKNTQKPIRKPELKPWTCHLPTVELGPFHLSGGQFPLSRNVDHSTYSVFVKIRCDHKSKNIFYFIYQSVAQAGVQ